MPDEIPNCPYCGHNMWLRKKKRGNVWNNETRKSNTIYRHYVGCSTCFMRGPLMQTKEDAIIAYECLVRKLP